MDHEQCLPCRIELQRRTEGATTYLIVGVKGIIVKVAYSLTEDLTFRSTFRQEGI
ncbi:MAG: hypothetical protein ACRENL_11100 [Candidatus Dormibacteria bacterium]